MDIQPHEGHNDTMTATRRGFIAAAGWVALGGSAFGCSKGHFAPVERKPIKPVPSDKSRWLGKQPFLFSQTKKGVVLVEAWHPS